MFNTLIIDNHLVLAH